MKVPGQFHRYRVVASMLGMMLLLVLGSVAIAVLITGSTYNERKDRGFYLTDQINQVRSPANLTPKYLLDKVADLRAEARVDEYNRTGTAEFSHDADLSLVRDAMDDAGWCWQSVGEVIGYSSGVPENSQLAVTADYIVDLWQNSPTHWSIISASRYRVGGGSWAYADNGRMMFFIYYVVDPC